MASDRFFFFFIKKENEKTRVERACLFGIFSIREDSQRLSASATLIWVIHAYEQIFRQSGRKKRKLSSRCVCILAGSLLLRDRYSARQVAKPNGGLDGTRTRDLRRDRAAF